MRIKKLYRFIRPDGGVTVSTTAPEDGNFTELARLIADDGFILTDGTVTCSCIDVCSPDGWYEEISAEEAF